MNLDDFKQPWQQRQRDLDGRVDHVIKKARSRMAGFDRTIWWRDMQESIVAALLIVFYTYQLFQPQNLLGTFGFGLGILACVLIIAILYWARQKGKVARTDLAVEDFCQAELARVDRQIWLLRNVHWWYLGPLFVAIVLQMAAGIPEPGGLILVLSMVVPLFGFIYWLNQVAVRDQLLPLKQALTETDDDDKDGDTITDETITPLQPLNINRRRIFFAAITVAGLIFAGGFLAEQFGVNRHAPTLSPFTAVQFEKQQIIVTYQERNYQWLELDGMKVEDIIAAAKWRHWGRWQKRVSEDLVDVLWGMGHQPGDTVSLLLRDLETSERIFVEQAPMTAENRNAVYQKNNELETKSNSDSNLLSEQSLDRSVVQ